MCVHCGAETESGARGTGGEKEGSLAPQQSRGHWCQVCNPRKHPSTASSVFITFYPLPSFFIRQKRGMLVFTWTTHVERPHRKSTNLSVEVPKSAPESRLLTRSARCIVMKPGRRSPPPPPPSPSSRLMTQGERERGRERRGG